MFSCSTKDVTFRIAIAKLIPFSELTKHFLKKMPQKLQIENKVLIFKLVHLRVYLDSMLQKFELFMRAHLIRHFGNLDKLKTRG